MGKGSGTSKDQLKRQNDLVDKQLAEQKEIRDKLMESFGKYLTGDHGFTPEQVAALETEFLNSNDAAFNDAGQTVRAAVAARGGNDLPLSGSAVRSLAGLEGAKATAQSKGLIGIKLADLTQALTNKFNAGSVISGQGTQVGNNIAQFNAGAGDALSNYVKAEGQGFGSTFASAFGGSLGTGLSAITTGGISEALKQLGKPKPAPVPA
jgi:hypothetical protein